MFPTIIFNDNNWSNFWRNSFTSNNRKFELSFVIFEICQPFETLKESTFESDKGNLFNSLSCLLKLVNCVDDLSWNEKLNPRILLFMVPNLTKQGGSRFTALVYCWLHFYCFLQSFFLSVGKIIFIEFSKLTKFLLKNRYWCTICTFWSQISFICTSVLWRRF